MNKCLYVPPEKRQELESFLWLRGIAYGWATHDVIKFYPADYESVKSQLDIVEK